MDNMSIMSKGTDDEEIGQGWQAPKSKRTKKSKKFQVVVATRTSSRVPRDGVPIATTKPANRVMARNDIAGTTQNPFTVLNITPNEDLHSVISDLDLEIENMDEQPDVFRAEEIARAS